MRRLFGGSQLGLADPADPSTWAPDSAILFLTDQLHASAADENVQPNLLLGTDIQIAAEQVSRDIARDLAGDCNVYCNLAHASDGSRSPTPQESALTSLAELALQGGNPANLLAGRLAATYQAEIHLAITPASAVAAVDTAFSQHAADSGQRPGGWSLWEIAALALAGLLAYHWLFGSQETVRVRFA